MDDFPAFMRNPANAIAARSQSPGVEGYVFDGADGGQMACWTCAADGQSEEHVHDFDEYFTVVAGRYDVIIEGRRIPILPGQEMHIPKNIPHAGAFTAGTRTIHAFGGKRAQRREETPPSRS